MDGSFATVLPVCGCFFLIHRRDPTVITSSLLSSPKAPSAPSHIHFSELTTTSVNVSWGEPKQANGIIEGYRLVYEPCTPVDGEKLCLQPNNFTVSCHSLADFLRQWFTTSCLLTIFFFNSCCLISRSNLLHMGTGPAVTYMARLINYAGMLLWDFAQLLYSLRETWLIAG